MPTTSEEVALESRAEELGLPPESVGDKPTEKVDRALCELETKSAVTPEYIDHMRELTDATSATLAMLAESSGSPVAKELASKFDTQIKGKVSAFADKAISKKFGSNFSDVCSITTDIIDKGLELAGFPHDPEDKKREEMRKLMLIMIALIAAMFLKHMGITPETVALIGMAVSFINENKSKSPYDIAVAAAEKVANDKDLRHKIGEAAISGIESVDPGMKALGLREKATAVEKLIDNPATKVLYENSKRLIATVSIITKDPKSILQEFNTGLDTVLSRTLADNPDFLVKFTKLKKDMLEGDLGETLKTTISLAKDEAHSRGIVDKAKSLVSSISSVGEFIDKLKKTANDELALTHSEKLLVEKATKEMKQFLYERYAKPVSECCVAANSLGAGELASRLGFSKDVLKTLAEGISQLSTREVSTSR
jgi:hypothetical protein